MAYANPSTFVAGNVLTAAQMNVLANNDRFFHGPPTVRVRRDAAQTIATGVFDTVQFDTEDWDTNTIWSSTNNDQLFARTAGKYLATGTLGFVGSSAGTRRELLLVKNSTARLVTDEAFRSQITAADFANNDTNLSVTGVFSMTTSDYLTLQTLQDTGGNLNTSTDLSSQPKMSMLWFSS